MMNLKSLGDYNLIRKLGEGAFGKVYLAEHRFLKKKYTLKILPEEFSSDEGFISRFEKEIGVLAKLDHPAIAKIYNISYADGYYFLVIDGIVNDRGEVIDLEKYLKIRGKILKESEIEKILRQIASALDFAHQISANGEWLAHRGLKLSNVLIDEDEQGLRVYVTDFGLTKIIGEGRVLADAYDRLFKELGSKTAVAENFEMNLSVFRNFAFLSPEQRRKEKVDIKADIYAFGVLAYYLIAREIPEGYFELPSKLVPEYKLNWDLIICKCLQKDPMKRPKSLTEMLNSNLSPSATNVSSLDVLSWEEVGKKVENAMQLSFEFSSEEKAEEPPLKEESPKPVIKTSHIERPEYDPDPGAIFQKDMQVSHYKPKQVEVKEIEPLLTEMVIIPGGTYMRGSKSGSRDEAPPHTVKLLSFALDIHSVTNEQFARFLEAMGGDKDVHNNDIIRLRDSRIKRSGGKIIIESGYAKHPVVGVTWYGAYAYAEWVGKRLPTEAEWEIAAMGGVEEAFYPTGADIDHKQANFFSSDTTPVMSFPPNGYGLFDMAGNIYEWCNDWYAYNYYDTSLQEPDNPKGPPQGVYRVLRGGCWKSLKEDLRCAHRHRNNPGTVNSTYGFRCAADVS